MHKQHNILMSGGIDFLQYVHSTVSSPFFSLSVYYSQVVACAVCLIPTAGRTVSADEKVSSSLLLSICVYSSVILCTAREERATRGGERQEFEQRAGHLHLSRILINRRGWLIWSASMCVITLPQPNVVKILNVTWHQSEVLITLGSCNYPCIIFWIYLSRHVVLVEGSRDDFLLSWWASVNGCQQLTRLSRFAVKLGNLKPA